MSWKDSAGSPFDTYKRDAVATNGMVSTNHPLGSAAGLEMLAMGGQRYGRGCGGGVRAQRCGSL